ncbi:phosphoglycerate mutase [Buchnera aphidicola str. Bp (Baizongia pistaciae)]|uniref:2,3-bisphosphoglycerate-dependent phosphoglycerate mutase n=1 Tax=Buchnera aphidicola subsp. Baizongia pistaciae (strain Bp) TaxID=224915 RepID=GPMA_BUCBP|nr:2,3-diphosphoglycerate-dependent phosphoglycerate mutase [Buchnera aphidicola]Q89AJ4.1 RecName: Full=2,3-bisphosphoglycerate-dependent phosphoglycerate mutase; Short=BPG-dependent PGAM; Short=PGAM; Short=Phosphoglyceromutase; Short=dPGM [Buchnera aphidicola str. Bp (Baizongia pistaciae)]AAO27008.1 phosphoglycerate mutase [Buchnera aphidicola str. Bp (Baizongia pistaciae)]
MKVYKLVLMRHGESIWNELNKFTGWHDVDLSNRGVQESLKAAKLLKKHGFYFDYAYSSVLKRSIHTLWNIIKFLDQSWIPVKKSWRLNERHYGALEGLNKDDVIQKYGNDKVQQWRRSFNIAPPKISYLEKKKLAHDSRYNNINFDILPYCESLKLTTQRVLPYWLNEIFPRFQKNTKIIIVAHGNSLRALIKYLNNINDIDILNLNIATGFPIIYEFNSEFKPIQYYYLKQ